MFVAVVDLLGRPRVTRGYEERRIETKRILQQEVLKLKVECSKRDNYRISFLNPDDAQPPGVYGRDGAHLNREGDISMCKRFLESVTAAERLSRMGERSEEYARE